MDLPVFGRWPQWLLILWQLSEPWEEPDSPLPNLLSPSANAPFACLAGYADRMVRMQFRHQFQILAQPMMKKYSSAYEMTDENKVSHGRRMSKDTTGSRGTLEILIYFG